MNELIKVKKVVGQFRGIGDSINGYSFSHQLARLLDLHLLFKKFYKTLTYQEVSSIGG